MLNPPRCPWAVDPWSVAYHDREWGIPCHEDRLLFELLILEGFQAGLSWLTILKKRPAFREAFDRFQPEKVAAYSPEKCRELTENSGIVRNKRKIAAAVTNAQAFLQIQEEYGSFDAFIWSFTNGKPILNNWQLQAEVPATSALSDKVSAEFKKRGFKFVGSTIIYSYLGAIGVINDHLAGCPFNPVFQQTCCK
ncbi:MAG: DNA-3-methyladenine glycosylase I [Negativicutes bacterium]|nr:DNA-3-methyladenine glycosylase I [Negativicutes bacterium]